MSISLTDGATLQRVSPSLEMAPYQSKHRVPGRCKYYTRSLDFGHHNSQMEYLWSSGEGARAPVQQEVLSQAQALLQGFILQCEVLNSFL